MNGDRFVTVFDVATSGFKDWQFPAFGLIFVFVGTIIFFGPRILERLRIPYLNSPSMRLTFFRYAFLGFAIFWTGTSFIATYNVHLRHQRIDANGCRTVEGRVENFIPMPYEGHADESFDVGGVHFNYSDYSVTDAFNHTASHGGPITAGEFVRICYDPSDHAILRLAIRGFRGKIRNYAEVDSMFGETGSTVPKSQRSRSPQEIAFGRYAWLVNIWVALYFVDIGLTLAMVVPYLRTFRVLQKNALAASKLPLDMQVRSKTKLRNSFVRWDETNNALWLRGRGFNYLQAPVVVVRFNVDPASNTVTDSEMRLSLGAMVVFLMFAITALLLFASAISDRTQAYIISGLVLVFFWCGRSGKCKEAYASRAGSCKRRLG